MENVSAQARKAKRFGDVAGLGISVCRSKHAEQEGGRRSADHRAIGDYLFVISHAGQADCAATFESQRRLAP
jgi:hypothetical protein